MKPALAIALSLVGLAILSSSCVEEIVKVDTLRIVEYKDRVLLKVDTVETITEVPIGDTVFVQVPIYIVDSVFIENEKYVHYYHDTLYWYVGHVGWTVHPEVQPIVTEFYEECTRRRVTYENTPTFVGGVLTIDYWYSHYSPMPSGWTSFTLPPNYHGWVIMVSGDLSYNQMWASITREMAVRQLGKSYSTDPQNIMSPLFSPNVITQESSTAAKRKYYDQIFKAL